MAKKTTEETKDTKATETKAKGAETGEQDASGSYVSKLSIKALGCDPRLPSGANSKVLCRISGFAQGLKSGEDKNTGNIWTALQGDFEGVNCEAGNDDFGKTLRSGKLFLPAGIQDVIEGAVREIENRAGGAESPNVVFGLEIRSVKATNRIGYSYEARNLMPARQSDPLAQLRKQIEEKAGVIKAIAAPAEK